MLIKAAVYTELCICLYVEGALNYCYSLMKKFYSISPEKVQADYHHRFHKEDIMNKFGALRVRLMSVYYFRIYIF